MEICADRDVCQGHGRCFAVAPDVVALDDEGYVAIAGELTVAAGREAEAREAVAACPEGALRIVGE